MTDLKGGEPATNSLAEQALNQARARLAPGESAATAEPEPAKKKPGRKAAVNATSSTLQDLEKTLWATADKLRANMDAAEYKHIVLGLIFLKYISDSFAGRRAELERRFADAADDYYLGSDDAELLASELEERDYYKEVNVFWVPEVARWESLRAAAKQVDIGKRIDEALAAIEAENPSLKNILDKRYARAQLPDGKLGELVDLVSTIGFGGDAHQARDLLGQVYEYFLGQFASAEGKKGGQFYTPASIVKTLVAVLNPHHGKVYDPCCGSGGMFVQSEKFIEAHGGKLGDVSIYGQESNPTTWRLAAMNLAIRGIDFNLGREPADTFIRNQHSDLRADFVLANPPFNISDWWHGSLEGDPRWVYGSPPQGNANYAWLQHMLFHLKSSGRAGIVLANGSMSSSQNTEGDIRRAMVEADVVEVMVALPGQLFFNTQIPACLWFLAKQKVARPGEVLFIDARKLGNNVSRAQIELLDSDIERIAQTVANWRGVPLDVGGEIAEYADIPGFCRSVRLAEIAEHGHVLTPGRYVGAEAMEDDDEAFADKMQNLTALLGEQLAKGTELDQLIRQKLGGMGYEL
ncbi:MULTISPECIES: type I restriction-modification system subunit M [unclassified Pseudomonas]|uniref:class I SAM-dependent DNA methyltransferase n=1 Tax=unclassified Pseudomonas TaxID=196821 RepID=UPI001CBC051D|nr:MULTISPECIES: class I SAM-dependent DNA methyltransferase [unclassified Pseudomonas]